MVRPLILGGRRIIRKKKPCLFGKFLRRQLVVVERVRKRQRADVGRQLRIDDELDRHAPRLAGLEHLLREAEALGLVEVLRRGVRRDTRHGIADDRLRRVVRGVEPRLAEHARVHAQRHLLRRELPLQRAVDVADELHRDPARFVGNEPGDLRRGVRRIVDAAAEITVRARDAVDRYAGESEQEHRRADDRRTLGELAVALDGRCVHQCQIACLTKNSTNIASAKPPTTHAVRRMPARRWSVSKFVVVVF